MISINRKPIIISIFLMMFMLLVAGCINNNENSNNNQNTGTWIDNYIPIHGIGMGVNNFWIAHPSSSEYEIEPINHLSWIQNSLVNNCVVFVVHKTGCSGCAAQAKRVIDIAKIYEDNIEFYDLDIPLGGDIEQMAYESYLYDPDGPPGYIAFTGVFTYVNQDGEIQIGWHSWEGDVADADMEDWITDAIYYYHISSR